MRNAQYQNIAVFGNFINDQMRLVTMRADWRIDLRSFTGSCGIVSEKVERLVQARMINLRLLDAKRVDCIARDRQNIFVRAL